MRQGVRVGSGRQGEEDCVQNAINPYIAGSPVRDPAMFFGRERVFETMRRSLVSSCPSQVVVLHGQRRIGKTSILYQIGIHLPGSYVPVLIDLQGLSMEGLAALLWEMAQVIRRQLRRAANVILPPEDRADWFANAESRFLRFFDTIRQKMGDRHLVLMFDETVLLADKVDAGALEEQVFSCLAALMARHDGLGFCFSIGSQVGMMEHQLSRLPRPVTYCEVSFLESAAARALICEPVRRRFRYQPQSMAAILTLTSGQPYYTQLVCHELFNFVQDRGWGDVTPVDVEVIRPRVVEMATAQLRYVWDETPVLGQQVLLALSEFMAQGKDISSAGQIGHMLLAHSIQATDADINDRIVLLKKRNIITPSYTFQIDLFRHWILQHQRLAWM